MVFIMLIENKARSSFVTLEYTASSKERERQWCGGGRGRRPRKSIFKSRVSPKETVMFQ